MVIWKYSFCRKFLFWSLQPARQKYFEMANSPLRLVNVLVRAVAMVEVLVTGPACILCCLWLLYYWSLLHSAILRSRADSLRSHVIPHEWIAFYGAFLNIHRSGGAYSAGMAGATWNCCHLREFCVHRTTMHHVTSCKATYVRCMRV